MLHLYQNAVNGYLLFYTRLDCLVFFTLVNVLAVKYRDPSPRSLPDAGSSSFPVGGGEPTGIGCLCKGIYVPVLPLPEPVAGEEGALVQ